MREISKKTIWIICGSVFLILVLMILGSIASKAYRRNLVIHTEPDIEEIRSICKLATTEVDYNNVAETSKRYGSFKKHEKKLWIEHKGIVKVGIDVNQLEIIPDGNTWLIRIPKAEILSVTCDPESFKEESFTISKSKFGRISAKEQNEAMAVAISNMKVDAESNHEILHDAQLKAKKIIENYFQQFNKQAAEEIHIKWELL